MYVHLAGVLDLWEFWIILFLESISGKRMTISRTKAVHIGHMGNWHSMLMAFVRELTISHLDFTHERHFLSALYTKNTINNLFLHPKKLCISDFSEISLLNDHLRDQPPERVEGLDDATLRFIRRASRR